MSALLYHSKASSLRQVSGSPVRSQCCPATAKLSLEDAIPLVTVSSPDPTLSLGGARGMGSGLLSHRVGSGHGTKDYYTPKKCGQHAFAVISRVHLLLRISSIPYSLHQRIRMQEHCITISKLDTHFLQLVSSIYGYQGWQKTASGLGSELRHVLSEKSILKFACSIGAS